MDCGFQEGGYNAWTAEVLFSLVSEGADIVPAKHDLDNACPWLVVAPALRDVRTKTYALHTVHGHPAGAIQRVLFVGLGKLKEFSEDEAPLDIIRLAIAKAVAHCQEMGFETILLPFEELEKLPYGSLRLLEEVVCAGMMSNYRGDWFKTKEQAPVKQHLHIGVNTLDSRLDNALNRGIHDAEATILARTLANTPANHLTPAIFAQKAQDVALASHLSCRILDENALKQAGLNAMLAVGQGSVHPPRLVVLETQPTGPSEQAPIVLIGKGICFDSGGICLKPAANMHEMKSDMSGAAAVLSALVALGQEGTTKRVIGILALAENMPDGGALRPGDVVRAHNGETVEIVNTDAEGRLVLCDALSYAQSTYKPRAIVDIATLTGACSVALGDQLAGLFCEDTNLSDALLAAGETAGEYLWPMPLWKGYRKKLKSEIADICHTGPRQGGAINAALFLQHFVPDTSYAHLDIAGVDWKEKGDALCPKGATGFGARLLLEFLRGGFA